jgi:hypothetical protein
MAERQPPHALRLAPIALACQRAGRRLRRWIQVSLPRGPISQRHCDRCHFGCSSSHSIAYCWPCNMQAIALDTSTIGRSSRQDSGVVDRQTTRTRVIMTDDLQKSALQCPVIEDVSPLGAGFGRLPRGLQRPCHSMGLSVGRKVRSGRVCCQRNRRPDHLRAKSCRRSFKSRLRPLQRFSGQPSRTKGRGIWWRKGGASGLCRLQRDPRAISASWQALLSKHRKSGRSIFACLRGSLDERVCGSASNSGGRSMSRPYFPDLPDPPSASGALRREAAERFEIGPGACEKPRANQASNNMGAQLSCSIASMHSCTPSASRKLASPCGRPASIASSASSCAR